MWTAEKKTKMRQGETMRQGEEMSEENRLSRCCSFINMLTVRKTIVNLKTTLHVAFINLLQ